MMSNTPYLASLDSYSKCMKEIFDLTDKQRDAMYERARSSMIRFDEEHFDASFLEALSELFRDALLTR